MKDFPTKREIAERYRVTPRTVENWVDRGWLAPPIKLGTQQQSRVRFTPESVAELERRLRGTASAA